MKLLFTMSTVKLLFTVSTVKLLFTVTTVFTISSVRPLARDLSNYCNRVLENHNTFLCFKEQDFCFFNNRIVF